MMSHRASIVLVIGAFSLVFIYKRNLSDFKGLSYIVLTLVGLFVTLLTVLLERSESDPFTDLNEIKVDAQLPTALSILIFAYNFQFMVFPAYSELQNKSNWRMEQVSFYALIIYSMAVIVTGLVGAMMYGSSIDADLLINLGSSKSGLSIFLRVLYSIILFCHLPFFFFVMKEYVLVIYEELAGDGLISHLEEKLKEH